MRTLVIAGLVVAALGAGGVAHADGRADELKRQGIKAAQGKQWAIAREKFAEAYALDPRPGTLFNLANAQESTDQLIAARNSYTTFLDQTAKAGREFDKFRKIARNKLASLDGAIPTLQVTLAGEVAGSALELDGNPVAADRLAGPIPVDPGEHVLVVLRGGEAVARERVTVVRGARTPVAIDVPAHEPPRPVDLAVKPVEPTAGPVDQPGPPAKKHGSSVFASPWFWTITVAVLAGAGAGYYYGIYQPPTSDPTRGTLGDGVIELP